MHHKFLMFSLLLWTNSYKIQHFRCCYQSTQIHITIVINQSRIVPFGIFPILKLIASSLILCKLFFFTGKTFNFHLYFFSYIFFILILLFKHNFMYELGQQKHHQTRAIYFNKISCYWQLVQIIGIWKNL